MQTYEVAQSDEVLHESWHLGYGSVDASAVLTGTTTETDGATTDPECARVIIRDNPAHVFTLAADKPPGEQYPVQVTQYARDGERCGAVAVLSTFD